MIDIVQDAMKRLIVKLKGGIKIMKPYIVESNILNYASIVIWTDVFESPFMYLSKHKPIDIQEGKVLFDFILYQGNSMNRFFEIDNTGGNKNNWEHPRLYIKRLKRLNPIRQHIGKVLTANYDEIVEHSILTQPQKTLIKNGITI
jgi:hypothetical protein